MFVWYICVSFVYYRFFLLNLLGWLVFFYLIIEFFCLSCIFVFVMFGSCFCLIGLVLSIYLLFYWFSVISFVFQYCSFYCFVLFCDFHSWFLHFALFNFISLTFSRCIVSLFLFVFRWPWTMNMTCVSWYLFSSISKRQQAAFLYHLCVGEENIQTNYNWGFWDISLMKLFQAKYENFNFC